MSEEITKDTPHIVLEASNAVFFSKSTGDAIKIQNSLGIPVKLFVRHFTGIGINHTSIFDWFRYNIVKILYWKQFTYMVPLTETPPFIKEKEDI